MDDGSGERYSQIFQTVLPCAKVISYTPNRGKGAALKAGLEYVQHVAAPDDVVVTADADGQHRPEDIEKTVRAAGFAIRRPACARFPAR